MTDRWMIVGQDPAPTAADLPIFSQRRGTQFPVGYFRGIPDLDDGDRWCRIHLPPEPEPEDDGVEVDGVRWKVGRGPVGSDGDFVFANNGTGVWSLMTSVNECRRGAKIAAALGLVPPPEPSWPPMRPMHELPDGHDERVLIAYGDEFHSVMAETLRVSDHICGGRLGWWPLPPHPKGGE